MAIKTVIFDFGGVLTENLYDEFNIEIYKGTRYEGKREPEAFLKIIHMFSKGKMSERQFFEEASIILNKNPQHLKKMWKKFAVRTKHNKEMIDLVKKLKKNGYKIALLSNMNPTQYKLHNKAGHYDHFPVKIISNLVGDRKPNKSIYKFTLRKLKMKPSEVVFIDDLERNIKPAKKIGMHTILFKNYSQTAKELKRLNVKF